MSSSLRYYAGLFGGIYPVSRDGQIITVEWIIKEARREALLEAADRASHNFGEVISKDSLERMAEE